MRKPTISEVFNGLPDSMSLNSRDVLQMFGYKDNGQQSGTWGLIKKGLLPEPDFRQSRGKLKPKLFWRLGTIRQCATK